MKPYAIGLLIAGTLTPSVALSDSMERLNKLLSLSLEELLNQQVTISTDIQQSVSSSPAVVTVLTANDFKATGATNLVELLEEVPGIHVRTNQFGYRPLIEFRGANAKQTLLMVNGVPLKDLMWGFGIFWKGLAASPIERVEIIRGPGSALYGADASGGVINVITKTASGIDESEFGIRTGSFNSKSAWLQHGGDWNGYQFAVSADLHGTDGHAPHIEADRAGTTGNANYGWDGSDLRLSVGKGHWKLLVDHLQHRDLETGMTGAAVLDPLTAGKDSRYGINLLYSNPEQGNGWGLDAKLRYHHLDYSSGDGFQERPPGYIDANNDLYPDGQINQMRSAEHQYNIELSGLYSALENHKIKMGAGATRHDLYHVEHWVNFGTGPDGNPLPAGAPLVELTDTPYAFAPEKARDISYVYLQDAWTVSPSLELTAGARYDHYSDFGGTLNPRLALVWQNSDHLTTKLMYGQAFRAPSYQELYSPTSWAQPNSDLEPERSQTLDLAFTYTPSNTVLFNLNLYHFKQNDLIAPENGRFENTGQLLTRGMEFEMQWQANEQLRLGGNYTLRKKDTSDESEQQAYLRADWAFQHNWNWNLQNNWIGARDTLSPQWSTDTTLRYAGSDEWEVAASVRNLFNNEVREYTRSLADDLPLPGRHAYLELRYKF